MANKKQTQVKKMTIKCPCSIGDTVYVTKSYFDDDGYFIQGIDKTEVIKITVIVDINNTPFFEINTRANSYGTWLGDTFPDEESAKASFARKDY